MAIRRPARSTRMSVSAPLPGPISSTVSCPSSLSASAMRPRMRRSVRKCWPRLLRVGGKAPPRPGGMPPSSLIRSTLQDDEGEIVAPGRVAGIVIEQGEDAAGDLVRRLVAILHHAVEHGLFTEPDSLAIASVGDAVGEGHEQVTADVPRACLRARRFVGHAERRTAGEQPLNVAGARDDERVGMAGVAIPQDAKLAIDDGIERGDEHLRRRQLLLHRLVEPPQHLGGIVGALRMDRRGAHRQRHDERGLVAVTRDVADHRADSSTRQAIQVVEVAADVFGGHHSRGDGGFGRDVSRVGEKLHLQVVRELHLLLQPLLIERPPNEARILDRGADLRGDRRDELLITGGERLPRPPIREVDDAERLAAVLGGPENGHGEHRALPEPFLGLAQHLAFLDDDGVQGAEDVRAHTAAVVEGDGPDRHAFAAKACDDGEGLRIGLVHEDGGSPCPDGLAHFAQDGGGTLLERHRAPQDLADRVEEIDLLVALGELVGCVLHLERVLQILRDDGTQELQIAVDLPALDRTRAQHEPGGAWSGDRHDDEAPSLGGLVAYDAEWRQELGGRRIRAAGAGDEAERALDTAVTTPDGCVASGGLVEGGEDLTQLAHARLRINLTTLPDGAPFASKRSTRSIRARMRNNPRPSSRSMLSGSVASRMLPSRSNGAPSSRTSRTSWRVSTSARTKTRLSGSSLFARRIAFEIASLSATGTLSESWRAL